MSTADRLICVAVGADRFAEAPRSAQIVADNSDYTVRFDIDAEAGFDTTALITAVFATRRGEQTVDFTGTSCSVPVMDTQTDGYTVKIGLTQGTIKTTTSATVRVIESVKSSGSSHADPYVPDVEPISTELTLADLIRVNDVSAGKWVKATLAALAALIGGGGGGDGGDSYWRFDAETGELTPVSTVDALTGIPDIHFAGGGEPWRIIVIDHAPTANDPPEYGIGSTVMDSTTGAYYIWGGNDRGWKPVVLDLGAQDFVRSATAVAFTDLPVQATLAQYFGVISRWYSVIRDKQDKLTAGPGVSLYVDPTTDELTVAADLASTVAEDGVKAPTSGAVYDALAALAEAVNTALADKYTMPATGIPKTALASTVQASLGKADTALQAHQDISGKQDKYIGTANAGKFLVVGSDGNITAVTMSAWQGGSY